jgi:hypothetical protein
MITRIARVVVLIVMRLELLAMLLATSSAADTEPDNSFLSNNDVIYTLKCSTLGEFLEKWPMIQSLCNDIKYDGKSVALLPRKSIGLRKRICDKYTELFNSIRELPEDEELKIRFDIIYK